MSNVEGFSSMTPKPINIDVHFLKKFLKQIPYMNKLLFLSVFVIIILVGGSFWFYKNSIPVTSTKKFEYFVINKGASASQVGVALQKAGLIKSALAFKLYMQFTGQSGKLQTGEFKLSPSYSLFETINTLFKSPIELWVTIPEGLRREEIAQRFVVALDKPSSFADEFLQASTGKEGYLFPETYLFPRDVTASQVVKKMTDTFNEETKDGENYSGLTFSQVIILASIVERETKTDAERPTVAGIMLNRLDAGMPLQVDATVQYAVGTQGNWWPILTQDDLAVKSAYNTYLHAGLPPAPISNPGESSIKASLNPEKTDYWYYIHDTEGQIHYAKTLVEHNANISKYLK